MINSKKFYVDYHISSVIRQSLFLLNNPKNLDLSYKMDLALWDCLGRVKLVLQQNYIGLIKLFVVILERGKPHLIAEYIWYLLRQTKTKCSLFILILNAAFLYLSSYRQGNTFFLHSVSLALGPLIKHSKRKEVEFANTVDPDERPHNDTIYKNLLTNFRPT